MTPIGWDEISILWKAEGKLWRFRTLKCPRCGKEGVLMQKTTISKRKYKYTKWYVYHEAHPSLYSRIQKWCYLNKNHLRSISIENRIRAITHMKNVVKYLRICMRTQ